MFILVSLYLLLHDEAARSLLSLHEASNSALSEDNLELVGPTHL